MATYTAADIIRRARQKADMQSSGFITQQEDFDLLNESYAELYDLLVGAFENYYVQEVEINLDQNVVDYDLPDDFYKSIGFDYKLTPAPRSQYVTLRPFMEDERNSTITATNSIPSGTVRLRYVPLPPVFTADADEVDGINGWDVLLTIIMAMNMLSKEESSTTTLERQYARQLKRIEEMAINRDIGFPKHITDIYKVDIYNQFSTLRYQLNQGQVRFMSTEVLSPSFLGIW